MKHDEIMVFGGFGQLLEFCVSEVVDCNNNDGLLARLLLRVHACSVWFHANGVSRCG